MRHSLAAILLLAVLCGGCVSTHSGKHFWSPKTWLSSAPAVGILSGNQAEKLAAEVGNILRGDGLNLIVVNPYSWFVSADFKDALHLDYSGHSKLVGGIAAALGVTVGRYLPAAATGLAKGMMWYDPAEANVVKFISA